jgi:hypothetical protein
MYALPLYCQPTIQMTEVVLRECIFILKVKLSNRLNQNMNLDIVYGFKDTFKLN